MSDEDKPKSAVELAMERLRKRDSDSGIVEAPPSDQQKAEITEARKVHAAKVAELEILHRSKISEMFDPEAREKAEEEKRHEMMRLKDDLERRIGRIRRRGD